mmetsp:Transcript_22167/g.63235  ORF Transcript_22167/g.63235 Transcript_22167/m.63235 type:complete len:83 (+) Transcript_22167:477-725(+)
MILFETDRHPWCVYVCTCMASHYKKDTHTHRERPDVRPHDRSAETLHNQLALTSHGLISSTRRGPSSFLTHTWCQRVLIEAD